MSETTEIAYRLRYNYSTGKYLGQFKDRGFNEQFTTSIALPTDELADGQYYAMNDEDGNVPSFADNEESSAWVVKTSPVEVTAYNKETLESKVFSEESEVTDDYTLLQPDNQWCVWNYDDSCWDFDYASYITLILSRASAACESAIVAGTFTYGDYTFGCTLTDQINLQSVYLSLLAGDDETATKTLYASTDGETYDLAEFTLSDIKSIESDMEEYISAKRLIYSTFKSDVSELTTKDEIDTLYDALSWESTESEDTEETTS